MILLVCYKCYEYMPMTQMLSLRELTLNDCLALEKSPINKLQGDN